MTDSATITREDAGKDVPVVKLAIASTIGTIIEAYDFVLYGTVAALVFDKLFFPDAAPVIASPVLSAVRSSATMATSSGARRCSCSRS
jgi:MHS family shikimate/dehydroshikimate transporter-like MFS transporter